MYLQHATWERESKLRDKSDQRQRTVVELTERLDSTMKLVGRSNDALQDHFESIPKAVLALSERLATQEAALKAALAQIIQVVGYTEERHKQLLAASVRGNQAKRPSPTAQ